ncbi:SLAP domain-containing protein [Lactobacillus sp. R2/2]|nr:SLAP domain-containing protein [Lactobacillus sp. R2/2]MEB3363784.1 SLAP domain-containing protein [Lactobacillus sp. R2/2]
MKFFKKVGIGLAATVLTISPLLPSLNHIQTVQAAPKAQKIAKNRITLVNDAPVYNQYGQRLKARKNGNYSVIEPDVNGFCYVSSFDVDSLDYYGTIMINGQKYYKIGQGEYINDGDVNNVNGKSSKTGKLVLNHRSAIYTKTGKLKGKTLPVKSVVNYQGQVKQTQSNQKYYFAKFNVSEQKATFYYLPTATVNGKDCYAIGKNCYIRANNVDSIDGYPLCTMALPMLLFLKRRQLKL